MSTTPPQPDETPPPDEKPSPDEGRTFSFEFDASSLEASFAALRDQLVVLAKKGRYTKVRFKFRGKPLLPDIPLAAVVAVEGLTFYWAGLLRVLVFHLAGGAVLDVELVNDSARELARGKEALLAGEAEEALAAFHVALDMDPDNPEVHLNVGVASKLLGQLDEARAAFERCLALAPQGPHAAEAERALRKLEARGG